MNNWNAELGDTFSKWQLQQSKTDVPERNSEYRSHKCYYWRLNEFGKFKGNRYNARLPRRVCFNYSLKETYRNILLKQIIIKRCKHYYREIQIFVTAFEIIIMTIKRF